MNCTLNCRAFLSITALKFSCRHHYSVGMNNASEHIKKQRNILRQLDCRHHMGWNEIMFYNKKLYSHLFVLFVVAEIHKVGTKQIFHLSTWMIFCCCYCFIVLNIFHFHFSHSFFFCKPPHKVTILPASVR